MLTGENDSDQRARGRITSLRPSHNTWSKLFSDPPRTLLRAGEDGRRIRRPCRARPIVHPSSSQRKGATGHVRFDPEGLAGWPPSSLRDPSPPTLPNSATYTAHWRANYLIRTTKLLAPSGSGPPQHTGQERERGMGIKEGGD